MSLYPRKEPGQLFQQIMDAVQKKAATMPEFNESGNGCIRVLIYSCAQDAEDWITRKRGLSRFQRKVVIRNTGIFKGYNMIADYECALPITPEGSRVCRIDTGDSPAMFYETYAITAMKIADCSYAQDNGIGLLSGLTGETGPGEYHGYAPYYGALCAEVYERGLAELDHRLRDWCGIYVSVATAGDPKDDLICAWAAVDVIREFFESEGSQFGLNLPEAPDFINQA